MKLAVSLIALLLSSGLYAQAVTPDYAKAFTKPIIGLKAGVNLNNQNISQNTGGTTLNVDTNNFTSWHVGVFGQFMLSEKLGLQPELLYSIEGSNIVIAGPAGLETVAFEIEQKLSFLKVPVLIKFIPFNNGFFVYAGPQMGFLLSDEINTNPNDGSVEPLDSAFKSFEFSGVVGAEYFFSKSVLIGGRYSRGLSDLSNTSDASLKGETVQFYLGLKLF